MLGTPYSLQVIHVRSRNAEGQAPAALTAEAGKQLLKQANAEAAQAGVWGSPYFIADGSAFFGADRLAQLEWQLSRSAV